MYNNQETWDSDAILKIFPQGRDMDTFDLEKINDWSSQKLSEKHYYLFISRPFLAEYITFDIEKINVWPFMFERKKTLHHSDHFYRQQIRSRDQQHCCKTDIPDLYHLGRFKAETENNRTCLNIFFCFETCKKDDELE